MLVWGVEEMDVYVAQSVSSWPKLESVLEGNRLRASQIFSISYLEAALVASVPWSH